MSTLRLANYMRTAVKNIKQKATDNPHAAFALTALALGVEIGWFGPTILDTANGFHRSGHSWWTIAGFGSLAAAVGVWTGIRITQNIRSRH